MSQWITIKDASTLLGRSVGAVRKMVKREPSIHTRLENTSNGGFKMYLNKEALLESFAKYEPAEIETLEYQEPDMADDVKATIAPPQEVEVSPAGNNTQRAGFDELKRENTELKIELERWKCRSEEYKNRFEHELLERYRERKINLEQNQTKDSLVEQLNLRLKDSNQLLLKEQKNLIELNHRFTPRENDLAGGKNPVSLSWDLAMIIGSAILVLVLLGAFAYILS